MTRLGDERDGRDSRTLDVEFGENGAFLFSGVDLGPATAPVSDALFGRLRR